MRSETKCLPRSRPTRIWLHQINVKIEFDQMHKSGIRESLGWRGL
uniref:Uncharacterized protein n=1 Tax=Arundo donax TaxID=35708 RepID=A0A0A9AGH9_ARUDO